MNSVKYMGYTFIPYGNVIGKNAQTRFQRLVFQMDTYAPLLSTADGFDYNEFNKLAEAAADIYYCPETNRHYVPTGSSNGSGLCPIDISAMNRHIKLIEQNRAEDCIYSLDAMKKVLGEDYAFHQSKTAEEVKRILENGEMPENDNNNVPFVLQAGNLDIEMTINYGIGVISEDGVDVEPMTVEYFCCVRNNGEWESFEEIPYGVDLDAPDIEAEMFRVLVKFAEKRDLNFFAENNTADYQHRPPIETEDEDEMEI